MFDSMVENEVPGVYASAHGGHSSMKSKENYVSSKAPSTKAINKILADTLNGEDSSTFNDLVSTEHTKANEKIQKMKNQYKENQDPMKPSNPPQLLPSELQTAHRDSQILPGEYQVRVKPPQSPLQSEQKKIQFSAGQEQSQLMTGQGGVQLLSGQAQGQLHPGQVQTIMAHQGPTQHFPGQGQAQILVGQGQAKMFPGHEQARLLARREQAQLYPGQGNTQLLASQVQAQMYPGQGQVQMYPGQTQAQIYPDPLAELYPRVVQAQQFVQGGGGQTASFGVPGYSSAPLTQTMSFSQQSVHPGIQFYPGNMPWTQPFISPPQPQMNFCGPQFQPGFPSQNHAFQTQTPPVSYQLISPIQPIQPMPIPSIPIPATPSPFLPYLPIPASRPISKDL